VSDVRGVRIDELLSARAAEMPESAFLRFRSRTLTFRETHEASNRLAHGLAGLEIGAGDTVGMLLPNCAEFVVAWFALARIGAVTAGVNTAFRGAGLEHLLEVAACRTLILDASLADRLEEIRLPRVKTVLVRGDADAVATRLQGLDVRPLEAIVADRDDTPHHVGHDTGPAMLVFTSGTTGRSKACTLSHRYAVRHAELIARHLRFTPDDVLYSPFPLFHVDAAVFTVMPALVLGATAAIGERFRTAEFWREVRAFGATVFDFMGATLAMLWKQPPAPDDADNPVRLAWGVPMPEFADGFEQRFGLTLVEVYGLTDTGIPIYSPCDQPRRPGACGRAVAPFTVRIVDADDDEVPDGEVGELVVRSDEPAIITDGYFNDPTATLAATRNLWFHTGDLAWRDPDGFFHFVGRKKDVIRRRGENISAFEVEEIVGGHPGVLECAAFGVRSELTEEDVKVCVVRRPGTALAADDLVRYCEGRMSRHMVPRYVEFVDVLPRTPTEKVEKYRLKEQGITAATWDRERGA
jgi:crotonobetaine/carnitine-CoA ligase